MFSLRQLFPAIVSSTSYIDVLSFHLFVAGLILGRDFVCLSHIICSLYHIAMHSHLTILIRNACNFHSELQLWFSYEGDIGVGHYTQSTGTIS